MASKSRGLDGPLGQGLHYCHWMAKGLSVGRSIMYRTMRGLVCAFSLIGFALPAGAEGTPGKDGLDQKELASRAAAGSWWGKPAWSPDGRWLSFSDCDSRGVYLLDTATQNCLRITDAAGSGYACNFSRDGKLLGFKLLIPAGEESFPLQVPVVFDVAGQKMTALHKAVARCGVPSFASDGTVAFAIDRELLLTDSAGQVIRRFDLDSYANLTPISPDGKWIAYNDYNDQLWFLDTATGLRTLMTKGEPFFNPIWSPDSTKIVASTLTGQLKVIEVGSGKVIDLDRGSSACWSSEGTRISYCQSERISGVRLLSARMYQIGADGGNRKPLVPPDAAEFITAAAVSPDGKSMAIAGPTTYGLVRLDLVEQKSADAVSVYQVASTVPLAGSKTAIAEWPGIGQSVASALADAPAPAADKAQVRVIGTVPYLHQVYDTPDYFNGHWACGATSAMMGLSYYNTLPYWDITVSTPWSHTSHYGRYVSDTYSFRGYTYNYSAADPNGRLATGGYGYIVRNNWRDTKGYMRDYIINHGLGSAADSSPNWTKLQTEINNSTPFVLLNMLTSSGHYILTVGYYDNQRTVIFNDPYGNKNVAYPSYYGTNVNYDWPGYNNGYQNLNEVEYFIYCRGSVAIPPTITAHPVTQSVVSAGTASFSVTAGGSAPLSYQWQKNGSNLSNGGHYSGVTTATLTISNASSADVASYRCVVTNSYGTATSNAASLSLYSGQYDWIVESRSGGKNFGSYAEAGAWSSSTGKSAAPDVTAGIGSRYCYTSTAGAEAAFHVTPPAAGPYDIFITGPYSTNAAASVRVVVNTAAGSLERFVDQNVNTNPTFCTTWQSLGQFNLNGGITYAVTITSAGSSAGSGSTVVRADAVRWRLVNGNPPVITQQPVDQSVCVGGAVSFTVGATGEGALSYQWQKNGTNLANGGHYAGVTTSTLIVGSCDASDAASYQCIVTSSGGAVVSSAATLSLRASTAITSHPLNVTITEGASAQFGVAATGDSLSYQWQKYGVNVVNGGRYSGANSTSLSISNCSSAEAGSYRCVVSGQCGIVTSNAATLIVNPPIIPGDFDSDGDVDMEDFGAFQACRTGSMASSYADGCAPGDLDGDNNIDVADWIRFLGCISGADVPGDPNCVP